MMGQMIRKNVLTLGASIVIGWSPPAYPVDSVAVEVGRGDDRTNMLRIAMVDRWHRDRPKATEWRAAGYWDLSAAVWDNAVESTLDVGFTPVFRFERGAAYVEAAIGLHLVQTRISTARIFSTAFQFGDHIGAGFRAGNYDFGIRVQHLSNAGIDHPNPGINFVIVRLQYYLR
jgi:lipid A 3-O-deacylase